MADDGISAADDAWLEAEMAQTEVPEPVVAAAPDPKGTKAAVDVPPPKPGREWEDLYPLLGEFHPSFTLLGTQPSVVVAMRGGMVAKCNRPGSERVVHSAPL